MSLYDSLYQEQSVFITFRTISELVNTESAVVSVFYVLSVLPVSLHTVSLRDK